MLYQGELRTRSALGSVNMSMCCGNRQGLVENLGVSIYMVGLYVLDLGVEVNEDVMVIDVGGLVWMKRLEC